MSRFTAGFQAFYDELKRRHVFRVAAAYVVGAFFVLEAANLVFEGLAIPAWVYRTVTVLVLVGFPITLVLAWLFQWTPKGIRRETDPPAPEAMAPQRASATSTPQRSATVRAFAFVGLGIVVAIVGMGLSLPYMYAQREGNSLEGQREGIVPVGLEGGVATMAVLPFVSLTGDDAGFADGLAEDITAALAQLGSVNVVSRTTSEAYRDSDKTARVIGEELGVGIILEGTIRRAGDAVRVTVQLIDAARDRHLWANTYDREIDDDVFDVQSGLAQEIVAAIQSVVTPTEADDAERRLLASREAEEVADRGVELLSRADPAYDAAAEDLFEQALAADSSNPRALAGIAQTMATRVHVGGPPALLDSAQRHALHAIEIDPEAPDGYAAHAFVLLVQGKIDSAMVALRRANERDETGDAFEFEWADRIEMVAPGMLEVTREALESVTFEAGDGSADGADR